MAKDLFKTVQGVNVTDLTDIYQCYSSIDYQMYHVITVNVSADNMKKMIEELTSLIRSPRMLTIEIPTSAEDEKELREDENDSYHNDLYYLEEISNEKFIDIFHQYDELFINDGFLNFGLASQDGIDELIIKEYKIFYILTDDPEKYERVLNKYDFVKEDKVKTVWETFTEETPGSLSTIRVDEIDIYDLVENLKNDGLYLAQRIEK